MLAAHVDNDRACRFGSAGKPGNEVTVGIPVTIPARLSIDSKANGSLSDTSQCGSGWKRIRLLQRGFPLPLRATRY